jgi:hypothetical protein
VTHALIIFTEQHSRSIVTDDLAIVAALGLSAAPRKVPWRQDGCSVFHSSFPFMCNGHGARRGRWRLWHGQVGRGLELIGETMATLDAMAGATSPAAEVALKVGRLLGELETYVCGQSDIIIDYATARRCEEPISTAVTESTVQWLLHRRMNA